MIRKTITTLVLGGLISSALLAETPEVATQMLAQPVDGGLWSQFRNEIAQDRDLQVVLAAAAVAGTILCAKPLYHGITKVRRATYRHRGKVACGATATTFAALVYAAYKKGFINTKQVHVLLEKYRQSLTKQVGEARDSISSYASDAGSYVWGSVKGGMRSVVGYFSSLISHTGETVPTGEGALDLHA